MNDSTINRRDIIKGVGATAGAVLLALFSGWAGAKFAHDYESIHDLSVSFIKTGNASPPKIYVGETPWIGNPFGTGQYVAQIDPNGSYGYTAIAGNSGDYPETNVVFSVLVILDPQAPAELRSFSVDASSGLLRETINIHPNTNDGSPFQLIIPRLNPKEWVSLSTSWSAEVQLEAVVRSDDMTEEESV